MKFMKQFGAAAHMLMKKSGSVGLQDFNYCLTCAITVPLMDAASIKKNIWTLMLCHQNHMICTCVLA